MTTNADIPTRGSTACSAVPPARRPAAAPGGAPRPAAPGPAPARHPLGAALHAVGVYLDTAFRVVVLGTDGLHRPDGDPVPPRPRAGQRPGAARAGPPGAGRDVRRGG